MAEFIVPLTVVMRGAQAIVTADNESEAVDKVRNGDWDSLDTTATEVSDWFNVRNATRND